MLSDGPQVAAPIPEDSFAINSAQAADLLGLRPGRFVLVPAVPELTDHSHRGVPSRRVLLAKQTDDSDEEGIRDAEPVPYILDLRPVQLHLCQAAAPDGVVDVAEVCRRLAIRCPRGFHVRLYGGAFDADAGNHSRRVQAGDTLTVEYHPDYVRDTVSQFEPGTYSLGTSAAIGQGYSPLPPTGSASSTHSGSADAGTGGSATRGRGPAGRAQGPQRSDTSAGARQSPAVGLVNMWCFTFSSLHAIPDGKVNSTSVCQAHMLCQPMQAWSCRLHDAFLGTRTVALYRTIAGMSPQLAPLTFLGTLPFSLSAWILILVCAGLAVALCCRELASDFLLSVLLCILARNRGGGFLRPLLLILALGRAGVALGVQLPRLNQADVSHVPGSYATCDPRLSAQADTPVSSGLLHLCPPTVRPLPTPCRSSRHGARPVRDSWNDVPSEFPEWPLRTLLEESCWSQEGYPLYLAATLIETLNTHFTPSPTVRQTLCLHDLVPPCVSPCSLSGPSLSGPRGCVCTRPLPLPTVSDASAHQAEVTIGCTPLGFSLQSLVQFLRAPPQLLDYEAFCRACPAVGTIPNLLWPDIFHDFHQLVPANGLIVYTDGSYTPGPPTSEKAGWAAIFLDPSQGTFSAAFGPVIRLSADTNALISPYVAECYALMAAALIATVAYHDRPLAFMSDCIAAVGVAEGKMRFELGGFAQAAASAHHLRRQLCSRDDVFHHVPGHCGFAGNEIADRASKAGANQEILACGLHLAQEDAAFWLSSGAPKLPWVAMVLCSLRGDPGLPPINRVDLGNNHDHAHLCASELIQPFVPEGAFNSGDTTPS